MTNDTTGEEEIIIDLDSDLEPEEEDEEEKGGEKKEERKPETPEARKSRLERQLKQVNKKLGIEEKPESKKEEKKGSNLDSGEKALLVAYGIKGSEEMALAETFLKKYGMDIDELVEDEVFTSKLKTIRADKETKDAMPTGTKRSGNGTRDSVDYWLAKGELPQDNPELARRVVNAKIAKSQNRSKFSTGTVEIK